MSARFFLILNRAATFGLSLIFALALPWSASAATYTSYQAMILSLSMPQTMAAGGLATVTLSVQNLGPATWYRDGANAFSLYRYDSINKVETASAFAAPDWLNSKRVMLLPAASVKPNASAAFSFKIKAPTAPGIYHEEFILCAEGAAWLKNSKFALDIKVTAAGQSQTSQSAPVVTPPPATDPVVPPSSLPVSSDWSAQLIDKGGSEWQIDMEDHVTVTLAFKNTGAKTWTSNGSNYVSIYAVDGAKERTSQFKDYNWLSATQAVKLKEAEVKPGQTGHILLELRAPKAPGSYQETFALAAENTSWISGSQVTFPIKVPLTGEFIATAPPGSDQITSVTDAQAFKHDGSYAATMLLRSAKEVVVSGNGRQDLTFGFKNTGRATWNTRSLRIKGVVPALVGKSNTVRDDSWLNSAEPVNVTGATKPGEIGFLNFKIKGPARKGSYHASFQLYADGQAVDGGDIDIPITVTADGYIEPEPTPTPVANPQTRQPANSPTIDAVPLNGDESSLPVEPTIRVGIYKPTDDAIVILARYAPLTVWQGGNQICHLAVGQSVTVTFTRASRVYRVSGGDCSSQSSDYFRVRADDNLSPMEMTDFSQTVSWLPGANDNKYRTQLELRYTPATDAVWVINELPFEWYLKGIAETSNSSPMEYQKALLTAARTYALYHIQRASKHASEYYHVDAKYDQVYRGYGAEARDPAVVAAVDSTRGQIVTYAGKLAITPYYSRSDGRTRAWTEVWGGGPYPWLVSVPVPWDQGRTLWGHGVGLSATGALGMAADGKTYDQILKWFYTGIELRKAFK